jgi:tryptophan-rich sensory protein
MTWMEWYNSLPKPTWTPAPSTISLIWMILYPIILISFGFVFIRAFQARFLGWSQCRSPSTWSLTSFAGLRNVPLACVDILIVWATIIWCVVVAWPVYRWIVVAQVPYFVWVSTATVIQVSITWMNR